MWIRRLFQNLHLPVTSTLLRRIALASVLVPALFFGLAVQQGTVVYDLWTTKTHGTGATANVLEKQKGERSDVTYDYVTLEATLPDGSTFTREKLSLPHGVMPPLMDRETLAVRVLRGADIEVVITETIGSTPVVDTQMRIAGLNGLMSLLGALLFGGGVWYWNRSLHRNGDPAERGVDEPDPEHPARQVMRP